MARKPRIHVPGAKYHVTSRGNGGKDIFLDEDDYRRFVAELLALQPLGFKIFADCLMPSHFHLLVEVGAISLSNLMQIALSQYAHYFNYRRRGFGHVFQGRFYDSICETDSYFLESIRYIHLNPVRAGLVTNPQDWSWSSHRAYLGLAEDPLPDCALALSMLSPDPARARQAYAEFIARGREQSRNEPLAVGSRASLDAIARDCAAEMGVPLSDLMSGTKRRQSARTRRLLVRRAFDIGYKRRDIADFLGCVPTAVSKMLAAKIFTENFTSGSDPSFT